MQLSEEKDDIVWGLEKRGIYSVRSLYRQLKFGGVISRRMKEVWRAKLPLKVKVFVWQMFHDRLQTAVQLKKRNWPGSELCVCCDKREDVNHIMFRCHLARFVWSVLKEIFEWRWAPVSVDDFSCRWLEECSLQEGTVLMYGLGVVSWVLWRVRNKMAIEGVVPNKPTNVLYKIISFMLHWKALLDLETRLKVEAVAGMLRRKTEELEARW